MNMTTTRKTAIIREGGVYVAIVRTPAGIYRETFTTADEAREALKAVRS